MEVVFSQRAIAAVMAETAEKIQTETGGLFLGKVIGDTWYVVESIDPGPNSIFEVAYFCNLSGTVGTDWAVASSSGVF